MDNEENIRSQEYESIEDELAEERQNERRRAREVGERKQMWRFKSPAHHF